MKKTMTRQQLESLLWREIHSDFKGKRFDGAKCVLHLIPSEGTCSVPISSLTDAELLEKIPSRAKIKHGLV